MKFVKMHGLGNDFVFIEDKQGADKDFSQLAVKMCAQHTGVGADGLIVIVRVKKQMCVCGLSMLTAVKRKCAAMAFAALPNTYMTMVLLRKKNLLLKRWLVL